MQEYKISLEEFEAIKYQIWDFLEKEKNNDDLFVTRLRKIFIKYQFALKNNDKYIELDSNGTEYHTYLEFKQINNLK